jgi:hypothetical protein
MLRAGSKARRLIEDGQGRLSFGMARMIARLLSHVNEEFESGAAN